MQRLVSIQNSSPASSAPLAASRWSPATTEHAFDGTITSACESTGITLEQMFEMMRWAKESDPRIRELLATWDALDPSEQQDSGTADAVRQRLGLAPLELLRIVADVACRIAMYQAQIIAAVSHPHVVEKTVELALNAEDDSNKLTAQTILHKATGFSADAQRLTNQHCYHAEHPSERDLAVYRCGTPSRADNSTSDGQVQCDTWIAAVACGWEYRCLARPAS